MEREIDLKEISDGRFVQFLGYGKSRPETVKAVLPVVRGMGSSILLDPYDIYRLSTGTGLTF